MAVFFKKIYWPITNEDDNPLLRDYNAEGRVACVSWLSANPLTLFSFQLFLSSLFKHSTMKQYFRTPNSQCVDWTANYSGDQR